MNVDVKFRRAKERDLELMLAWRSHPKLYENFYLQNGPLKWEDHVSWWESREDRIDWIIVAKTDSRWRDVGCVNVSSTNTECPEVGVWVGEITLWGNGVATKAVEFVLQWIRDNGYLKACARILDRNDGSIRLFRNAGFRYVGEGRNGESEYRISLG